MEFPQGRYRAQAAIVEAVKMANRRNYIQAVVHSLDIASMMHPDFAAEESDAVAKGVSEVGLMVPSAVAGAVVAIAAVVAGAVVAVVGVEHLPEVRNHAVKGQEH
jgi:hypothetical protein